MVTPILITLNTTLNYFTYIKLLNFKFKVIRCASDFIKISDYVACRYEKQWWISLVTEISEQEQDAKLSFLHPHEPSRNFRWPRRINVCWKISVLNNGPY